MYQVYLYYALDTLRVSLIHEFILYSKKTFCKFLCEYVTFTECHLIYVENHISDYFQLSLHESLLDCWRQIFHRLQTNILQQDGSLCKSTC